MGHCLDMIKYGRALAWKHGPRTNISWSLDKQTLELDGKLISLYSFRSMVWVAIQEALESWGASRDAVRNWRIPGLLSRLRGLLVWLDQSFYSVSIVCITDITNSIIQLSLQYSLRITQLVIITSADSHNLDRREGGEKQCQGQKGIQSSILKLPVQSLWCLNLQFYKYHQG
jgi:hypothetical protein